MENLNNDIDLINKNAIAGLVFKSGSDFYTITDHINSKILISFGGIENEISPELFYRVMQNENIPLLESWRQNIINNSQCPFLKIPLPLASEK